MKGLIIEQLLINSTPLNKICESDKLTSAVLFRIGLWKNKLDSIISVYLETKKKMITKFIETDSNGNAISDDGGKTVKVKKELIKEFNKEFEGLLNEELELPNLVLKFSELDQLRLTPNDVSFLSQLITFEE